MKKLVIKPYRQNMGMDLARAQGIWESLRKAIDEIFSHNASLLSFEELYRCVHVCIRSLCAYVCVCVALHAGISLCE